MANRRTKQHAFQASRERARTRRRTKLERADKRREERKSTAGRMVVISSIWPPRVPGVSYSRSYFKNGDLMVEAEIPEWMSAASYQEAVFQQFFRLGYDYEPGPETPESSTPVVREDEPRRGRSHCVVAMRTMGDGYGISFWEGRLAVSGATPVVCT